MEKEFELKLLKVSEGEVECKYKITETSEEGDCTDAEFHVKVAKPIHRDLLKLYEQDFAEVIAEIMGLGQSDKIVTTGVSFAGKNDNIRLSLMGEIFTAEGRVKVKVPGIRYKTGDSDICAKLTVYADKVVNEAYAYLFEGKTADVEVFGE